MNVSLDHFAVINSLNLDRIKLKLMHGQSGEGWDHARADAAEAEYRRFLYLTRKYPEERMAPSVEVDTFWHYHILDTVKYAEDCEQVFGAYLHHDPYVGIGEGSSPADQARAADRMREIYDAEFGAANASDSPSPAAAWCTFTTDDSAARIAASAGSRAAWCTVADPGAKAAWCTVTDASAAWCTVTSPRAKAAWCTVTAPKTEMTWRALTDTHVAAAWCTVAGPEAKRAWCTVTQSRREAAEPAGSSTVVN
jgi:hypothetical protein